MYLGCSAGLGWALLLLLLLVNQYITYHYVLAHFCGKFMDFMGSHCLRDQESHRSYVETMILPMKESEIIVICNVLTLCRLTKDKVHTLHKPSFVRRF